MMCLYLQERVTNAGHIMLRGVAWHDQILQDSYKLWNQLEKEKKVGEKRKDYQWGHSRVIEILKQDST